MPQGKGSKSAHPTPSHLAEHKTLEQLQRMAKKHHVPQSKDGKKFNKAQLARRVATAMK